jgi:hypothetical protein
MDGNEAVEQYKKGKAGCYSNGYSNAKQEWL